MVGIFRITLAAYGLELGQVLVPLFTSHLNPINKIPTTIKSKPEMKPMKKPDWEKGLLKKVNQLAAPKWRQSFDGRPGPRDDQSLGVVSRAFPWTHYQKHF